MFGGDLQPRGAVSNFDHTRIRLTVFGLLIVVFFVALFSRLWYLQVLASEDYREKARDTRIRRILHSDPPRGRILDRNGKVLVGNRSSLALTADRTILDEPDEAEEILARVADLVGEDLEEIESKFNDALASPYGPIPIVFDVKERHIALIEENPEDFPGIGWDDLWLRTYPQGEVAAHILGFVGEISEESLESDHFKDGDGVDYGPGDLVGRSGVEYVYDRYLRGQPMMERVTVNSSDEVIGRREKVDKGAPGSDLVLGVDVEVQKVAEDALANGIESVRAEGFEAPAGAVVVMDPTDGAVVALASYPTYDPNILADGMSDKEYDRLGNKTPKDPDDDALFHRAIQSQRAPGSTFKVVTAGAALSTDVADTSTTIDCNPSATYPPGDPFGTTFNNWTSADMGIMGFPESLEVSCDTFYYELGWALEQTFEEKEEFQRYARIAGMGDETGIDLPGEAPGRVPDRKWCRETYEATKNDEFPVCGTADGGWQWLPGYTINMSIGQGDMITTPLQMAVTYAAIASEGTVWRPRVGWELQEPNEEGKPATVERFEPEAEDELPLEPREMEVLQDGLELVIGGPQGTARGAFSGFPLDAYPLAGKTGTAELGETEGLNDAWFVSYGPTNDPRYVISVYVERAGHGGESAAPIARQVWEGIFGIDKKADVVLSEDASG